MATGYIPRLTKNKSDGNRKSSESSQLYELLKPGLDETDFVKISNLSVQLFRLKIVNFIYFVLYLY